MTTPEFIATYWTLAGIPPGLVHHVELDDADAEIRGTLIQDTLNNRRFCGQGTLDAPAYLRAVRELGYDDPFGIEIISKIERRHPFADVAADVIRTAQSEFANL